jgi:hypothetical protein
MSSLRFRVLLAGLAAYLLGISDVNAERPAQSRERLLETASHAIHGTVVHTYERQEKKDGRGFEWTYGVAEIKVVRVAKGSEIKAGDRTFVRYWEKKWVGGGSPPPDSNGNWEIPSATDSVEVFVEGNRETGYDVLQPNGFFKVTKVRNAESKSNR